jgi:hypothetical protein
MVTNEERCRRIKCQVALEIRLLVGSKASRQGVGEEALCLCPWAGRVVPGPYGRQQ